MYYQHQKDPNLDNWRDLESFQGTLRYATSQKIQDYFSFYIMYNSQKESQEESVEFNRNNLFYTQHNLSPTRSKTPSFS